MYQVNVFLRPEIEARTRLSPGLGTAEPPAQGRCTAPGTWSREFLVRSLTIRGTLPACFSGQPHTGATYTVCNRKECPSPSKKTPGHRRNGVLTHATLETSCEVKASPRRTAPVGLQLHEAPGAGGPHTGSRTGFPRAEGRAMGRHGRPGTVSVGGVTVLESVGTAAQHDEYHECLCVINLKMVKTTNFMFCIFTAIEKTPNKNE